jgi:cell division transport system permease protein
MTITLLIIFTAVASRAILTDSVSELRKKVDMSIYLKTETTDDQAAAIKQQLQKLSSVQSVTYCNAECAREQVVQDNKGDVQNPGILRIVIVNINDTSQLSNFVDTNSLLKQHIDPARAPSFAGERRASIESIGRAIGFAQQVGIVASLVFIAISSLIIFNTIRMAIFNRKEEIQMMKLIGADRSFIRGPFLVEAIVYGFIAAIIATGLGFAGLYASAKTLSSYQISVQPTIDFVTSYGVFVFLGMIGLGAFIGIVSSLLATQRYLKL